MKVCIVSPHIDDALLSCGILMQRHAAAGDDVHVLNIFSAGTNSENRQKEELLAQKGINARPYFLNELDAPDRDPEYKSLIQLFFGELRKDHEPYIAKVTERIGEFFAEHKIDLALFPLAAGTHIDHRIAHAAGRRIKNIPVRFYEDRPYILWPGVLQGRMNQIGSDAQLPKVTREAMLKSVNSYFYLAHFVPQGAYRDETMPLYFAANEQPSARTLKAKGEALMATDTEIKKLYDCLHAYESQTPLIYDDYDTFVKDSLAYERAMSGKSAYIERSWTLEDTDARAKADKFLKKASLFQLGALPTEQRHPQTHELADLSRNDIPAALKILKGIDVGVVAEAAAKAGELARLEAAIRDTFKAGNRVFFYGCGATGRLSLSIDYIWRYMHKGRPEADKVMGFMSGGDLALVHSIENFEDHPAFGARQVREIGFGPNDLLVSCTEGGETPSVIGATEEAARISSRKPFFLYCNPDAVLHEQVERSRRVLENPSIEKICLFVGPMALSGSTRLQASTVLMLGAGAALLGLKVDDLVAFMKKADFSFLKDFIEEESRIYANGDYVLYETDEYGITIMTDTTERAPTFSLRSFENQNDAERTPSLSYISLPHAKNAEAAWKTLLLRDPVPIEWDELKAVAGKQRLSGFDFSAQALEQRKKLVAPKSLHLFSVKRHKNEMRFELGPHRHSVDVSGLHPLFEHLFLKMAMNMHSTLVMGRLGRYESNVMTWVKPSNNKLVDRAIRYVEYLLHHQSIFGFSYEDICYQLYEEAARMTPAQSVVMMTVENLKKKKR